MPRDPKDEAWFQEQLTQLTPDRLRHLLRLGAAWDWFCTRMHHRLIEREAGRGAKDGSDDPDQWIQQWQAIYLLELYVTMGAPPAALEVPKRLLAAFEHRRIGGPDSLFALNSGGANRPTQATLKFRCYAVRAAVELRNAGTPNMDTAYDRVAGATAWIATDPTILALIGGHRTAKERVLGLPTRTALGGWFEDTDRDVRLGRYYATLDRDFPPGLSGQELADWLLQAISSPTGRAFAP